jgi:NADP-dependent 3-hydroxy acid dehydrogenase YdfG
VTDPARPVVIVVAAGPGVSGSLARRYAREGYDAGLVGVDESVLQTLEDELTELGATARHAVADITDAAAATDAIRGLAEGFGRVDVLHFNPSAFRQKHPLTLTSEELLQDVGLGVGALLTALQAVRPYMSAGGRVTATGSMAADKPWNEAASLGVQKAGLRNLVHSIDATLEPDGIRATSLTVRGTLGKEGPFTPDRVADAIFDAAHQDEAEWRTEVPYTG